ncbi:hypothetical protein ACFQVA_40380 [Actinomadura keratinilytica]
MGGRGNLSPDYNANHFRCLCSMTVTLIPRKTRFFDKEQYSQALVQDGRPEALEMDYRNPLAFYITSAKQYVLITVSGLRYDAQ